MYSSSKRRIRSIFIQQTGTYNNQWRRPMEMQCTPELQDRIVDKFAHSSSIGAIDLVTADSQLIVPSAKPQSPVGIVNGWDTKRLKFWIVIEVEDNLKCVDVITVQGYTEHGELSMSGQFDPRMTFFINNVTQSRSTLINNVQTYNLGYSMQMLHNSDYQGSFTPTQSQFFGLTPKNVFSAMENQNYFHTANASDLMSSELIYDTTNQVTKAPNVTSRTTGLASDYASKILNTYVGEKLANRDDRKPENPSAYSAHDESLYAEQRSHFYSNCSGLVDDSAYLKKNDFLMFLNSRKGLNMAWNTSMLSNAFTLDDLLAYDPMATHPDVLHLVPDTGGQHHSGITASWQSTDQETVFATVIAEGVASLASQCGMYRVVFKAGNRVTADGKVHFVYEDVRTVNRDHQSIKDISTFEYRVVSELLSIASFSNQMGFEVHVICDLAGETWVNVKLENNPEITYVRPTFCDSLLSPLVTNQAASLDSLATNFETLGENIYYAKMETSKQILNNPISFGSAGVFSNNNQSQQPTPQKFF
jgi:hypothetical protein